jgi:hypothetical protein
VAYRSRCPGSGKVLTSSTVRTWSSPQAPEGRPKGRCRLTLMKGGLLKSVKACAWGDGRLDSDN